MPRAIRQDRPPRTGAPRTAGTTLRQQTAPFGFWILELGAPATWAAYSPFKFASSFWDDGDNRDERDRLFSVLFALFLTYLAGSEKRLGSGSEKMCKVSAHCSTNILNGTG